MAKKYCVIDDIKEMAPIIYQDLGFDEESTYDKFIDRLISRASRRIDRYCNRPDDFFYGGSTVTEYHDGQATRSTYLHQETEMSDVYNLKRRTYFVDHTPIISVTSVHENEAAIGATDSWSAITKYRYDSNTGRFVFAEQSAPDEGIKNVRIIYVAGYSIVPDEIKWACEELVANSIKALVQQGLNAKIRFARPTPIAFSTPEVFTDAIREKLDSYKKRRM